MTPAARERSQIRVPMLLVSAAAWVLVVLAPHGVVIHAHDPRSLAVGWALMLTAMMLPLLVAPVRHVRDRSFAWRRPRAIALFVAGYGAIWMTAGALLLSLALAVGSIGYPSSLVAALMRASPLSGSVPR